MRRTVLIIKCFVNLIVTSVIQTVKRLPATWETHVRSLGQEDPLEKEMATHFSILAWKIPYCLCGRKESDTTELLHYSLYFNEILFPLSI